MDKDRKLALLKYLVPFLMEERGKLDDTRSRTIMLAGADDLWDLFRAFVNTRPADPAPREFLKAQDELLAGLIAEAGITTWPETECSPAEAQLRLWRGDITTLATDAIVNAANAQMLGCWSPGHSCIDNAIHTFAGVQLRIECNEIMRAQGHDEPTGQAKITGAYNLPSKHVIHTVGPIANGAPTALHRSQLAACYRSCLDLAAKNGLSSIAFCCISTGVFGFPQDEAAHIAVKTVRDWLAALKSNMVVVFNVFSATDEALYRRELGL